jgi:peptide/nickel transport system ATP-binding protein/oligopeptide transport system ATP-binding protein
MSPLLEVRDLVKHFTIRRGMFGPPSTVHALDGVSLTVEAGEMVALVGESGSGKTTLARCILGLASPTSGSILLRGEDVTASRGAALRDFRRHVQPVFQDPYASLDPRWPIARTIREPLDAYGVGTPADRDARVTDLLERVGLPSRLASRRPHELSGGQRQRVGIAAALALGPDLIVADEPVSALDVSVQAQILNLLAELHRDLGIAIILITHNLAVVEHVCDRAVVLYLGRVAEEGPVSELFGDPEHPYTQALMASIPYPDPTRPLVPSLARGEVPSPIDPPAGCRFHPRCLYVTDRCRVEEPALSVFGRGHRAACHVAQERRDAGAEPLAAELAHAVEHAAADALDHQTPVLSSQP